MSLSARQIIHELKHHAPFTAMGSLAGVLVLALLMGLDTSRALPERLFAILHPSHVFLSALATTAMYRHYGPRKWWRTLLIGYFGSVGIGTLSDCLIPFAGEWLLGLPNRHLHLGFIEHWAIVNPLAIAGVLVGSWRSKFNLYHGLHVGVSTGASLFHIMMALNLGTIPGIGTLLAIVVFVFLAVWVPCCTSDIVFPLWFAPPGVPPQPHGCSCASCLKKSQPASD